MSVRTALKDTNLVKLYNFYKRSVISIVCEGCIVKANCSEYCKDMDYLIIMCADVRYESRPTDRVKELVEIAKEVKEQRDHFINTNQLEELG